MWEESDDNFDNAQEYNTLKLKNFAKQFDSYFSQRKSFKLYEEFLFNSKIWV